jgi:putative ABC transport system substrate-binding protein
MRRRDFISLVGGAAVAWPLAVRAQQSARLPTIGFLGANTASAQREWTDAFVQRLRELDWIDGRTVAIEYRWAEGRTERFGEIATEFVRLKVDVIVTQGTPAVIAAKQATSLIPIIFASAGNPVATGLVASLARPGGNVTGLSSQGSDTVGKRYELLREIVPGLRRLAILGNVDNPQTALEMGEAQAAARVLGLEPTIYEIRRAEDIASAFERIKGRADALDIATDPLTLTHRGRIHTFAVAQRMPTTAVFREFVEAGADGVQVNVLRAGTDGEIDAAFDTFARQHIEALVVSSSTFFDTRRSKILALTERHAIPAIYQFREYAAAGGLMSYGIDLPRVYHKIGAYTGRILKGEKPAELPVVQPTKFELVINLKTAKALGLTIPDKLLALADEVIE